MEEIWIETDHGLEETPEDLRKEHSKKMSWVIGVGVVLVLIGLISRIEIPQYKEFVSKKFKFKCTYPAHWAVIEGIVPESAVAFIPPKEDDDPEDALIDAVSFVFF